MEDLPTLNTKRQYELGKEKEERIVREKLKTQREANLRRLIRQRR